MFIALPIIILIFYLFYLYEKRRKSKEGKLFQGYGFHQVTEFAKRNDLQVNHMGAYLPVMRSPRFVYVGQHESRDVEVLISQSLRASQQIFSLFTGNSSAIYQGALIVKQLEHIPDFAIIPREFGDSFFVESSPRLQENLSENFIKKYHLIGSEDEVLKLPYAFFEYIAGRHSLLMLESKNNSLAIHKQNEVIDGEWTLGVMLARSSILIDLLDHESVYQG